MHRDNNAEKEADILDTQVWLCMTEVKWVSWIQIYLSYVNVNSTEVVKLILKLSLCSQKGVTKISECFETFQTAERKKEMIQSTDVT